MKQKKRIWAKFCKIDTNTIKLNLIQNLNLCYSQEIYFKDKDTKWLKV